MKEADGCHEVVKAYWASISQPQTSLKELAMACRDGREEDVRNLFGRQGACELLRKGGGPDAHTPLMWAAGEGHVGVLKVLLEGWEEPNEPMTTHYRRPTEVKTIVGGVGHHCS